MENILEEITDELFVLLPKGWEKVVLYSEIEEKHYNIFFYVKINGEYVQCYNLEALCGTTEMEIDGFAEKMHERIMDLSEKTWTQSTIMINADLTFFIDYSYDEEFNLFEWKSKYLD